MKNWSNEVADIMASHNITPAAQVESKFKKGQRIFHQKFGYGYILVVAGNALEISFDKAGKKKLLAEFVETI